MKSIHVVSYLVICIGVVVSGCDLITNNNGSRSRVSGNDLVINEIFAITPDRYYSFSWLEIYNPTSQPIKWTDSTRPAAAFVVGDNGTLLSTTDNGDHWDPISTGTNAGLRAIRFREPDSGYAVGENGTILRSRDHGATWTPQVSGTSVTLNGVAASDPELGSKWAWVAGDSGVVLYTSNVGADWNPMLSGTTHNLHSLDMYSAAGEVGPLYAAGDAGTVLQSTNAGFIWKSTNANPNYSYYGATSSRDTCWAVGTNGIAFISLDAGKNYLIESTYVTGKLRSIFVSRTGYGEQFRYGLAWAVGDGGAIVRSTNYGLSWRIVQSPTTYNLNSVQFIDSDNGWAVGDHGTIIMTSDGGQTWSIQRTSTTANLYGAYFYKQQSLPIIGEKYLLFLYAQRKHVFYDQTQPYAAGTNPNYDFITKVDTGYVYYDPTYNFGINNGRQPTIDPVNPGSFVVINSDSGKFQSHFNLGPGAGTQVENVSLGIYVDSSSTGVEGGIVLWSLLPSSEVRLVKLFAHQTRINFGTYSYLQTDSAYVHDIDIVRYGGFQYTNAKQTQLTFVSFYALQGYLWMQGYAMAQRFASNTYAGNISAGSVPEWWSLSRYANDVDVYPATENSAQSFFLTKDPIPGWYSQRSR